jgi:hypothetical protein
VPRARVYRSRLQCLTCQDRGWLEVARLCRSLASATILHKTWRDKVHIEYDCMSIHLPSVEFEKTVVLFHGRPRSHTNKIVAPSCVTEHGTGLNKDEYEMEMSKTPMCQDDVFYIVYLNKQSGLLFQRSPKTGTSHMKYRNVFTPSGSYDSSPISPVCRIQVHCTPVTDKKICQHYLPAPISACPSFCAPSPNPLK